MKLDNFTEISSGTGFQPGDLLSRIVIRSAAESDLLAIEWDGEYQEFRNVYADVFRRTKRGLAVMWLADLAEKGLIGQVFVQFETNDRSTANGKTRAYVHSFRVRDSWQRRGLGKQLMDWAEADLLARGFREVTLNVARDNEGALRLYQRLGYHIVKEIPGRWSYFDLNNELKHAVEPGYRMMKRIRRDV